MKVRLKAEDSKYESVPLLADVYQDFADAVLHIGSSQVGGKKPPESA